MLFILCVNKRGTKKAFSPGPLILSLRLLKYSWVDHMSCNFFDLNDPECSLNGSLFRDPQAIVSMIEAATNDENVAIQLLHSDGPILDIAADSKLCFVQHSAANSLPPYLALRNPAANEQSEDEFHEFDVGQTPTPIELKYCIEKTMAIDALRYFMKTGRPLPGVQWDE